MKFELLAYFGLFLILTTAMINLFLQSKRGMIISLAIQYFGVFLLVIQAWSVGLSAVKLIAGWMAATFLGIAQMSSENFPEEKQQKATGILFKVSTGIFFLVLVFGGAETIHLLLPVPIVFIWSGMALICLGLLQMATSAMHLKIMIGLLTTLAGFEVIYSAIENSVLVAGLEALVTVGIALICAYLALIPEMHNS